LQDSNRTFFDDFALRIKFMREKRGLGLAELSGGAASTAKSWERGSRPRPALWDEVAARLGLSVSFVFLGKPVSNEDYDFIAKFADEIEGAREALAERGGGLTPSAVSEDQATYGGEAAQLRAQIRSKIEDGINAAGSDRVKLGWLLMQINEHVRPQKHWGETSTKGEAKLEQLKTEARQTKPGAHAESA